MRNDIDYSEWKVLAVDDQIDNLALFRDLMASRGVETVTASDGARALQLLDEYSPNMILLDLAMPDMDGWALLRKIRERPELEGVPVIAVTSLVRPLEVARLQKDGFDGSISKPFRIDQFFTVLVECYRQAYGRGKDAAE